MRQPEDSFRHGRTFAFYCASIGLLFFSVGFYRGLVTDNVAAAVVWWVPSGFWFLQLVYSALVPYVSIGPTQLRVRRWVFLPSHNLPRDGFSYELSDGNRVTLQVDGTKVATVQKVRMDERDWERFLEVLGPTQEPNPSA